MRIQLFRGDITQLDVEAIVNAANPALGGGGGVDGAIHRAGGPMILEECRQIIKRIGRCETGQAVSTSGGNLKARYVIHTVGPLWHGGTSEEEKILSLCYKNSLQMAEKLGCKTLAFPNISTGVYGFPKPRAALAVKHFVEKVRTHSSVDLVIFALFDEENYHLYQRELASFLTP